MSEIIKRLKAERKKRTGRGVGSSPTTSNISCRICHYKFRNVHEDPCPECKAPRRELYDGGL